MDYNEKMKELESFWQDTFDVCKAMIEGVKCGEQKLTGSIIKELNAFIKNSVDFLKYRETEEAFNKEGEAEVDELEACVLPEVSSMDLKVPEFPACSDDPIQ